MLESGRKSVWVNGEIIACHFPPARRPGRLGNKALFPHLTETPHPFARRQGLGDCGRRTITSPG